MTKTTGYLVRNAILRLRDVSDDRANNLHKSDRTFLKDCCELLDEVYANMEDSLNCKACEDSAQAANDAEDALCISENNVEELEYEIRDLKKELLEIKVALEEFKLIEKERLEVN